MYKHCQDYKTFLKERLPSISQHMTYSHQTKTSLELYGSPWGAGSLNHNWQSTRHFLKDSLKLCSLRPEIQTGKQNNKSMSHKVSWQGHPPAAWTPTGAPTHLPFQRISPTTSNNPYRKLRLRINSLKLISAFFCNREFWPHRTKLFLNNQKQKLGKYVSWSNLPMERDKRCKYHLTSNSPLPAPFPLLRDRNLNCKQPLTIYFYLTMSSFCLQEHPNHSWLLQDCKYRVPALTISPPETINGDGNHRPSRHSLASYNSKVHSVRSLRVTPEAKEPNEHSLPRRVSSLQESDQGTATLPFSSYICKHLFSWKIGSPSSYNIHREKPEKRHFFQSHQIELTIFFGYVTVNTETSHLWQL